MKQTLKRGALYLGGSVLAMLVAISLLNHGASLYSRLTEEPPGTGLPLPAPSLPKDKLRLVWEAYQSLPKPVLVHCSAGIDRTGWAVVYIRERLAKQGA
jgi:hypothetical protein